MEHPENLLWIIGAAVLLFAISFLGKKAEWFLNLVLRSVFGVIFMYFLNWGIEILGFTVAVGINAATALTVGILGFPGILVLYGLYALTDENAVKSRSCGILEGRMRKVTVKMCQRLFFYGKTLVRRKNNGYNPSYNQSRWLYQISYKI